MNKDASQNTTTSKQAASTPTQPGAPNNMQGNNRIFIYVIAAVVIIIALVVVVILFSSVRSAPSGTTTVMENHSANTTPVYMNPGQVQELLGNHMSNYYSYDLFNPSSPMNITYLEQGIPSLQGNVTSGWISSGYIQNSTYNISIQYYVFKTSNPIGVSQAMSSAIVPELNLTPTVVTPGTFNGLSYSYGLYKNNTTSFQILSGSKGDNAVFLFLEASPVYAANETELVDFTANATT